MAFPEMNSPFREIPATEKRPVVPAYVFISNRAAELKPVETTPGMDMWAEFRQAAAEESNYSRWAATFEINGVEHTTALFHIVGNSPLGQYDYRLLRCSCCLPDIRNVNEVDEEYRPCPAKDLVIAQRASIYKEVFGADTGTTSEIRNAAFGDALKFIMGLVKADPLAWPPSHRDDQLLLAGLAPVFDMPLAELYGEAKALEEDNVIVLHGENYPSISLAA